MEFAVLYTLSEELSLREVKQTDIFRFFGTLERGFSDILMEWKESTLVRHRNALPHVRVDSVVSCRRDGLFRHAEIFSKIHKKKTKFHLQFNGIEYSEYRFIKRRHSPVVLWAIAIFGTLSRLVYFNLDALEW